MEHFIALTIRLPERVNHSHTVRRRRGGVECLWTVVGVFVGFHHGHLGPVGVIDLVFEQTDPERVRNQSAAVYNRSPETHTHTPRGVTILILIIIIIYLLLQQ